MNVRSISERQIAKAARIGPGAQLAAVLGMAAGVMALALLVARLIPG